MPSPPAPLLRGSFYAHQSRSWPAIPAKLAFTSQNIFIPLVFLLAYVPCALSSKMQALTSRRMARSDTYPISIPAVYHIDAVISLEHLSTWTNSCLQTHSKHRWPSLNHALLSSTPTNITRIETSALTILGAVLGCFSVVLGILALFE